MIGSTRVKVCGITHTADVAIACDCGADFIGVNVWPGSPRFVKPEQRKSLLREIPESKRVAVAVNPTVSDAASLIAEGFAILQIHFDPTTKACDVEAISQKIGPSRLWLAPKLPDGATWPKEILPLADTFLHDAHAKDSFGGTGKLADWNRFKTLKNTHPDKTWILAGGLSPQNLKGALEASADFIDLNSGVELSPGLKSAEKLADVRVLLLNYKQT
ncbi:MAG: phosphoribosylanthranilate isomerase [Verrucomicrobia bacterium]|nr:phosphoribosylanthranilate isomerase [Verrucomicrobiota bacterium]